MTERPDLSGDPHDLVAGYLLDALDPAELARFVGHLPSCGSCRAEVALLQPTVADLATTVEVVPPAALEAALMEALFQEKPAEPESPPAQVATPTTRTAGEAPTLDDAVPGRATAAGRRRRWMWPAAAAAAFVLGIGVAVSTYPFNAAQDQPSAAEAEMQQIMEVTAAPDAHIMTLDVPGATTKLVVSNDMDMGAVLASDLPMPAKGREYHLWTTMDDKTVQSAATFVPDEDGHVATMLDTGVREAAAFILTVEEPGTPHPTTPPIAEATT